MYSGGRLHCKTVLKWPKSQETHEYSELSCGVRSYLVNVPPLSPPSPPSQFVSVFVEVRCSSLASGDPSEKPRWHLTSDLVCRWPRRTEPNNGRHVPWPCHHGNIGPFGVVGEGDRVKAQSLSWSVLTVCCCQLTCTRLALRQHKSVCVGLTG